MLILADRVKESSLSTGVGAVTLNGPVAGYQAFSGVLSSGDQTYYTIVNNQAWEVGVGTYSPSSISRDTILSSSTGSKINLSGQSFVFIAYPAEKSVYRNLNDQIVVTSSGIRFSDGTVQTTSSTPVAYYAGTGLVLSGTTFNVDSSVVRSGNNISLLTNDVGYITGHPPIAGATSINGSGRTYIQDVYLDSNGHVTGLAVATETVTDTTYTAGSGLELSGTEFRIGSIVVKSGDNISLLANNAGYLTSHPAVSSASSSNNSGRTYIQDILLDSNGHITGITTATETVVDTDTTYSAGTGLQLAGTIFSVDSSVVRSGNNISLLNNNSNYTTSGSNVSQFVNDIGYLTSHPAISAASSSNNSGRTYIQDILLDSNGHITGIVTATETVTDTDTTYTAGTGLQLSGTQFSVSSIVIKSGDNISLLNNNSNYISSGSNITQLVNDAGYLTSHPVIATSGSTSNSGYFFVKNIYLDSNGHVTGVQVAEEIPYLAGEGLTWEGNEFAVDTTVARTGMSLSLFNNSVTKYISSGNNISLLTNDAGYLTSHPSVLAASSSDNSGRTYIQDILLDSNGHITGITTATETVVDTNTTYTAGSGLNLVGTVFSTSGVGVFDSIYLPSTSPGTVSGRVYNSGGTLCFNGSPVGGSSYSAGSGLTLSGTTFHTTGILPALASWAWSSGTEVPIQSGYGLSVLRTGTGPGNLVQMSGNKLPAVDGSALTGIPGTEIICSALSGDQRCRGTGGSWTIEPTGLSIFIPKTGLWNLEGMINIYYDYLGFSTAYRIAIDTAAISGVTGHPVGHAFGSTTIGSYATITTGSPTIISGAVRSPGSRDLSFMYNYCVNVTSTGNIKVQMYTNGSAPSGILSILSTSFIKATKL
jgi:hypothetical protein